MGNGGNNGFPAATPKGEKGDTAYFMDLRCGLYNGECLWTATKHLSSL